MASSTREIDGAAKDVEDATILMAVTKATEPLIHLLWVGGGEIPDVAKAEPAEIEREGGADPWDDGERVRRSGNWHRSSGV